VVFIALANQTFVSRMSTLSATVQEQGEWDTSALARIETAKAQLRMFRDYPMGAGHQGTAWLSPNYIDERWLVGSTGDRASHNTVMSVLVDQGIPGILLFTLMAWSALKLLVRMKRLDKSGLPLRYGLYRTMIGGAITSVLGAGMFAQNLKAEVLVWCIVLIAVLWRLVGVWSASEQGLKQEQKPSRQRSSSSQRPPGLVER